MGRQDQTFRMFLVWRRCHIDIAESLANMHHHSYPITQILRTLLQSTVPGGRSDVLSVAVTWFSGTSRGLSLFGPTLPSSSPGVTDFLSLSFYKCFGLRSHFPHYSARCLCGYTRNLDTILTLRGPALSVISFPFTYSHNPYSYPRTPRRPDEYERRPRYPDELRTSLFCCSTQHG